MKEWWRRLSDRQKGAFGLYGLALGLMIFSLLLPFVRGDSETAWDFIVQFVMTLIHMPRDFFESFGSDGLAALVFLLTYLVVLPSGVLLWFGLKSRGACIAARIVWPALIVFGPLFVLKEIDLDGMGPGYLVWCGWVVLVCAAHWVMTPLRPPPSTIAGVGPPPSTGS